PHGPAGSSVVSVRVTPPASISAALGVYVAFGVEASRLNVPVPPLHVPLEAPPPIAPASCTCGLLAHTVWGSPALAVAARLMVIRIVSLTVPHGPLGSFVV